MTCTAYSRKAWFCKECTEKYWHKTTDYAYRNIVIILPDGSGFLHHGMDGQQSPCPICGRERPILGPRDIPPGWVGEIIWYPPNPAEFDNEIIRIDWDGHIIE